MSQWSLQNTIKYRDNLFNKKLRAGKYLGQIYNNKKITTEKFIELLLVTKRPRMSATSEIRVDGSDWKPIELKILADLNIAMNHVEVY